MNLKEILELKYPEECENGLIRCNSRDCIEYTIGTWNVEYPQPSDADIAAWEQEFELAYRQKQAVQKRVYPTWQVQLDMLYHDALNGTNDWVECIQNIKNSHPKPEK